MGIVEKLQSTIIKVKPLYYGHQGVEAKCPHYREH